MVIESEDRKSESFLSQFSYAELKNFIKEALLEKIEDLKSVDDKN